MNTDSHGLDRITKQIIEWAYQVASRPRSAILEFVYEHARVIERTDARLAVTQRIKFRQRGYGRQAHCERLLPLVFTGVHLRASAAMQGMSRKVALGVQGRQNINAAFRSL